MMLLFEKWLTLFVVFFMWLCNINTAFLAVVSTFAAFSLIGSIQDYQCLEMSVGVPRSQYRLLA